MILSEEPLNVWFLPRRESREGVTPKRSAPGGNRVYLKLGIVLTFPEDGVPGASGFLRCGERFFQNDRGGRSSVVP
jgi:hypothetical protein